MSGGVDRKSLAAGRQRGATIWLALLVTTLVPGIAGCGAEQPSDRTGRPAAAVNIRTGPQTIEQGHVRLAGTATPGATIDAGSVDTMANANGNWVLSLRLEPGPNDVTVAASHEDFSTAYDSVTITRRRTASEAAAFERSQARKRASAERRKESNRAKARETAARRKSENRAKARAERRERERRAAALAQPSEDDLYTMNIEVSRYLSALLDDPYSADPAAAIDAVQMVLTRAEGACEDALLGFSDHLGDTSGDPDTIRARVLDANYEVAASCEST